MGSENEQDALRAFGEWAAQAMKAIVEALQPVMDAIMEAARTLYAWAQECYREAGAIYGDDHDGLMRWWNEILQIARLEREAQDLRDRHTALAVWRLRGRYGV
jgi:hypothetical protein